MMTGPSINSLPGCASVNRNSWGGDPESLRKNRSAYYPRDQSLFVYYCLSLKNHSIFCILNIDDFYGQWKLEEPES